MHTFTFFFGAVGFSTATIKQTNLILRLRLQLENIMVRPKKVYHSKGLPKPTFFICKRTFERVVRTQMETHTGMNYRIAKDALLALQEGAEAMLVGLFEDAAVCRDHTISGRRTLDANDLRCAQELRTADLSVLSLAQRSGIAKPPTSQAAAATKTKKSPAKKPAKRRRKSVRAPAAMQPNRQRRRRVRILAYDDVLAQRQKCD